MNQPLTPEQFAELKVKRGRQLREMSAEELAALNHKREQTWAALSREEQTRLLEQRLADGPAGRLIAGLCWPSLAGHRSKRETGVTFVRCPWHRDRAVAGGPIGRGALIGEELHRHDRTP